jgi:hypothetical protein
VHDVNVLSCVIEDVYTDGRLIHGNVRDVEQPLILDWIHLLFLLNIESHLLYRIVPHQVHSAEEIMSSQPADSSFGQNKVQYVWVDQDGQYLGEAGSKADVQAEVWRQVDEVSSWTPVNVSRWLTMVDEAPERGVVEVF